MNINHNQQNNHDTISRQLYDENNEDNSTNTNNNNTNQLNNPITADTIMNSNWSTQWQQETTQDITYAPQAHMICQPINNLIFIGSDTSYTGMEANQR